MVSRILISIVSVLFLVSCGSVTEDNTLGGAALVLIEADPTGASRGATVELVGSGFSVVAAENVVSVGGAGVSAETYSVSDEGGERITFDVPEEAPLGETFLMVILEGEGSNTLPFSVAP